MDAIVKEQLMKAKPVMIMENVIATQDIWETNVMSVAMVSTWKEMAFLLNAKVFLNCTVYYSMKILMNFRVWLQCKGI